MLHIFTNVDLIYIINLVIIMQEKKIDLRILKTKKVIYDALEYLMKEKPFEEIKVSDICSKALINRSTFYAHYNDKYDLLAEFINNLKNNLTLELNKNENIKNSKEYYLEMIRLFLDHLDASKDTYVAIMINNQNSITMDILYDIIHKDIVKQIEDINNKGKIPLEIISKFYLGAVFNVCIEWLKSNNKYSKKDILNYMSLLLPDKLC